MYTSVVKSGCRFVDENCLLEKAGSGPFSMFVTNALGLQGNPESLVEATANESIKKKESAIKTSFKIEMNDEEKKVRDAVGTNVYHTSQPKQMVTLEKADRDELERAQLEQVAEEGQRESSDDGAGDEDPDEDLDF